MQPRAIFLWIGCAAALLGCKPEDDPEGTLGLQGRIEFSYRGGCFFGCPLEQPMLAGSSQTIDVSAPGDVEGAKVRSSNQSVAEVALERECRCERDDFEGELQIANDATCPRPWNKHCDNRILVQSHAAGRTELTLTEHDGDLLDRVVLDVREADRIDLYVTRDDTVGRKPPSDQTLTEGGKLQLEAELYARDGLELLAVDAVQWHSSAPEVAVISAFLLGRGGDVEAGNQVTIEAIAEGEATITVEVPSASAELELVVEPE